MIASGDATVPGTNVLFFFVVPLCANLTWLSNPIPSLGIGLVDSLTEKGFDTLLTAIARSAMGGVAIRCSGNGNMQPQIHYCIISTTRGYA